jgi:hypothetical protein
MGYVQPIVDIGGYIMWSAISTKFLGTRTKLACQRRYEELTPREKEALLNMI